MKLSSKKIYTDGHGKFYIFPSDGDYYVADAWKCDKNGIVHDILKNPSCIPIVTEGLKPIGDITKKYEYPNNVTWK